MRHEFGDLILTTDEAPPGLKQYDAVIHYEDGRGRFGKVIHSKNGDRLFLVAGDLIHLDDCATVRIEPVQIVVPTGFHSLRQPLPDLQE